MALEIDGFAVLGAIARHSDLFQGINADVVKTAKGFVGKQLKDKGLTVDALRAVANAITTDSFDLVVDGMSDAELKALLAKVDKLNGAVKTAAAATQRQHVADLARGVTQPVVKAVPDKAAKLPKAPPVTVERSGNSKAMKARRKV